MSKLLIFLLSVAFIFSSCSYFGNLQVEKRRYGKGYYVHHSGNREESSGTINKNTPAPESEKSVAAEEVASNEIVNEPVSEKSAILPVKQNSSLASENRKTNPGKKETGSDKFSPLPKTKLRPGNPKENTPPDGGDINQVLLLILAIFLSPIAVYLKEGASTRFWIDLICWILGGGLVFSPFFYGGALLLFAIIFAILIVLDVI